MSDSKDFAMDCNAECDKTCCYLYVCPFGKLDEVYDRKIEPANGKNNSRTLVKILSLFSTCNLPWVFLYVFAAHAFFTEKLQATNLRGELLFIDGKAFMMTQLTFPGRVFVMIVALFSFGLSMIWFHLFIKDVFPTRSAWSVCCGGSDRGWCNTSCFCTLFCVPCAVTKVIKHAEKNLGVIGAPVHAQGYNSNAYVSV